MPRQKPELEAALTHAVELFSEVRGLRSRRLFGGAGLYAGGLIFAIITEDGIYLKADDETKSEFEAAGATPFHYQPPGRQKAVTMNYWRLPDSAIDDAEEALVWAQKAIGASKRAPTPSGRRRQRG